ncbi:MAG: hypothetical protein PHY80_03155 [Rickettsiales bacterium]|nr:hypothetical protein [Rickettsiales bacterium]
MMTKAKEIIFIFVLLIIFFISYVSAGTEKVQTESNERIKHDNVIINVEQSGNYIEQPNNDIREIFKSNKQKKLEDITIFDVIGGERVSSELKNKVSGLVDQYQYELDGYRSIIANRYKQADLRIVGLQKDINNMNNFKDEMEQNLNLAKWMIISLSVGIICLTSIVVTMWKNIMSVNKNDVEVIFSLEKIKKDLKVLNGRIKLLEGLHNIETKKQISDDDDTESV